MVLKEAFFTVEINYQPYHIKRDDDFKKDERQLIVFSSL